MCCTNMQELERGPHFFREGDDYKEEESREIRALCSRFASRMFSVAQAGSQEEEDGGIELDPLPMLKLFAV